MTAEDIDLTPQQIDNSNAFDKLALTPHQKPSNYLSDHEHIILKQLKKLDPRQNSQTFVAFIMRVPKRPFVFL